MSRRGPESRLNFMRNGVVIRRRDLIRAAVAGSASAAFAVGAGREAHGQNATAPLTGAPTYETPLGIALEEYPYPYAVRFYLPTIERKQNRMAYMEAAPLAGARGGHVVVLLHGKNFYGAYWQETIAALTQAGHRVVVPDQIGFGKSSKPDDINYSFDLLAQQTAGLLDEIEVERAVIVGHSMGGMLAVRFARAYPERTVKLVLENPLGLEDYRLKVRPLSLDEVIYQELNQTVEQIRAYRKNYFVKWLPAYERFVEVEARIRLSGEFPRYARVSALTSQMIYQQPVRHELNLLRVPTLLIIGQSDRTAIGKDRVTKEVAATMGDYPRLGREAARDIPGARLVEIPNVGHIPHIEATNAFHAALLPFLEMS